jgi:amidophosphoribosyltransferase
MARESGARRVFFASAAPPVRFPNVYGIDMPTRDELIATGRTTEEIAYEIGADELIYQDIDALVDDVRKTNPRVTSFEASCFSGRYITGDVTPAYLADIEAHRRQLGTAGEEGAATQLDLNLVLAE